MATKILEVDVTSSTKFVWKIDNFPMLNSLEGVCSDVFSVGDFKWRVRIFPKGLFGVYDHLSLYVFPVDIDLKKSVSTEFSFAVTSQTNPQYTIKKALVETITDYSDRGWMKFMRLSELHDPNKGYIVNDTCMIEVEVSCRTSKEMDKIMYLGSKSCKIKDDPYGF